MRVLSFDVGTKNLALCDLTVKAEGSYAVNLWTVESCVPSGLNVNETALVDLVPYFVETLDKNLPTWLGPKYDYVLIENQPMGGRGTARNLKTKVLSHILQAHILSWYKKNCAHEAADKVKIQFVHPGLKLKEMPKSEDGKTSYRANKLYAISKTLEFVSDASKCETSESCVKIMNGKKTKKDDLADAFLQGKYFLELLMKGDLEIVTSEKPIVKKKRAPSKKLKMDETLVASALVAPALVLAEDSAAKSEEPKLPKSPKSEEAAVLAKSPKSEKIVGEEKSKKRGRSSK